LIRHAVAEELYLYPAVRAMVPEPAVHVGRWTGAHARIEQLLAELAEAAPDTLTFDTLITQLVCEVDQETMYEEMDLFPWLALRGDPQQLVHLGNEIQAFKDTAVVEKTPGGGLAIRVGDRVLHRWRQQPGPDVSL
jgi:hypothetical protein